MELAHRDLVVWRTSSLPYTVPAVPTEYSRADQSTPIYIYPESTMCDGFECPSGSELYRGGHSRGWRWHRKHVYYGDDHPLGDCDTEFDLLSTFSMQHFYYAQYQGMRDCESQINKLRETHPSGSIKRRLGYSRFWHTIPLVLTIILGMLFVMRFKANPLEKRT